MTTTSDDLTTPLGMDRDAARPVPRGRVVTGIAAVLALTLACGIGYVAAFGDPLGGLPYARVEIGRAPASPAAAPASTAAAVASLPSAQNTSLRQSAGDVEGASGVSVVRPQGAAPPSAVIVRVPDDVATRLKPAPDPRLVERTRYGALPRLGPDGARPLDVYARPEGGLPGGARPAGRIAIVVGGLGIGAASTADAVARLPGPVTLAFAPYGPDLDRMAASARADGHEIMLQVPMEPFDYPDSDPGPHTLTAAAKPQENIDHLHWAMGRFSGYVGLVNYMGGKVTADERALAPILAEAAGRGLGVLDDGSSSRSVLVRAGGGNPVARAELVVDAVPRADAIDKALAKLEATALAEGFATGSASALPLSVERIARWARALETRGILLVPASAAFRRGPASSASR